MSLIPVLINTSIKMDDPYSSYAYYNTIYVDALNNDIVVELTENPWDGCCYNLIRVDSSSHNVMLTSDKYLFNNGSHSVLLGINQLVQVSFLGSTWYAPIMNFTS